MTEQLIDRFKAQVAAAEDRSAADRAFFVFLREFAAKRAPDDFAKLETEARKNLEAEELEDLRPWFDQRIVDVRAAFVKDVSETLGHVAPADRDIYEIAARIFHEMAFDRLLAPTEVAGCA